MDAQNVRLYSAFADEEQRADFFVAFACRDQIQHLDFAGESAAPPIARSAKRDAARGETCVPPE